MSRYVDVDEEIRKINEAIFEKERDGKADAFTTCCFKLFAYALSKAPTADVEKVKHGKWLFVIGNCKEEMWMCDQCERCIRSEQMEKDELIKRYPYCHCGAKMDGDDK